MYYKAKNKALNNNGVYHLAAVLKRNQTVVKISTNTKRTHPRCYHRKQSGDICKSLHAEQHACIAARPGDVIYVMRFKRCGTLTMAKPCKDCQCWLREVGVHTVYYTNWEGEWNKMKLS